MRVLVAAATEAWKPAAGMAMPWIVASVRSQNRGRHYSQKVYDERQRHAEKTDDDALTRRTPERAYARRRQLGLAASSICVNRYFDPGDGKK